MKNYNENDEYDLSGRADEELKNEAYRIVNEDVFGSIEEDLEKNKKYNNYEYNYTNIEIKQENKNNKNGIGKGIVIFIIVLIGLIILVNLILNLQDEYFYDDEVYEEFYDIEYDIDNNGYLDYNEQTTYDLEKSLDYEKYYTAKEIFIDKENKDIYFELENRNTEYIDYADLNIAYYDEEGKLIDVDEVYISNPSIDKKTIECIHYERDFSKYDVKIIVGSYSYNKNTEYIDTEVELVSTEEDFENNKLKYTLKNNSDKKVSGTVYVIFYNEYDEIIKIEQGYMYDFTAGKTKTDYIYINLNNLEYSYFKIDTSSLVTVDY